MVFGCSLSEQVGKGGIGTESTELNGVASLKIELDVGQNLQGGAGKTKSIIDFEEFQIVGASIALSNSFGEGEVKTWRVGDSFVFTFQARRTGVHTLTVRDWDSAGNTNVETATINMRNGYNYRVRVRLGGKIYIGFQQEEGLVFYSTFNDLCSTINPEVGPKGYTNTTGFGFVPGKYGNSYRVPYNADFGVVYSNFTLPGTNGCIEFWAKLENPPLYITTVGDVPCFLWIQEGNRNTRVLFAVNDGRGGAGLCGQVECDAHTGIDTASSTYGTSYRYYEIISNSSGNHTDWHHYALVWKNDGFEDGRKIRLYLDGKLYPTQHYTGGSYNINGFTNSVIKIILNDNTQGAVLIDELKIWNYAKTNF